MRYVLFTLTLTGLAIAQTPCSIDGKVGTMGFVQISATNGSTQFRWACIPAPAMPRILAASAAPQDTSGSDGDLWIQFGATGLVFFSKASGTWSPRGSVPLPLLPTVPCSSLDSGTAVVRVTADTCAVVGTAGQISTVGALMRSLPNALGLQVYTLVSANRGAGPINSVAQRGDGSLETQRYSCLAPDEWARVLP